MLKVNLSLFSLLLYAYKSLLINIRKNSLISSNNFIKRKSSLIDLKLRKYYSLFIYNYFILMLFYNILKE